MNPLDPTHDSPKNKVNNELTVHQTGERTIFTVHKHPIGLLGTYSLSGVVAITVALLTYYLSHNTVTNGNASISAAFASVVFIVVAALCALYSLLFTKVYMGNSWILTSDSLTQVQQSNLFDRESSQLSLHNLEDISAEQNGFLPHILNYGIVKVETAGEKTKFSFNYCPNPNYYARQVLAARESFLTSHRDAITEKLTGSRVNSFNFENSNDKAEQEKPAVAKAKFLDPEDVAPPEPVENETPKTSNWPF